MLSNYNHSLSCSRSWHHHLVHVCLKVLEVMNNTWRYFCSQILLDRNHHHIKTHKVTDLFDTGNDIVRFRMMTVITSNFTQFQFGMEITHMESITHHVHVECTMKTCLDLST